MLWKMIGASVLLAALLLSNPLRADSKEVLVALATDYIRALMAEDDDWLVAKASERSIAYYAAYRDAALYATEQELVKTMVEEGWCYSIYDAALILILRSRFDAEQLAQMTPREVYGHLLDYMNLPAKDFSDKETSFFNTMIENDDFAPMFDQVYIVIEGDKGHIRYKPNYEVGGLTTIWPIPNWRFAEKEAGGKWAVDVINNHLAYVHFFGLPPKSAYERATPREEIQLVYRHFLKEGPPAVLFEPLLDPESLTKAPCPFLEMNRAFLSYYSDGED